MKEQILKQFDRLMSHLNSEENGMAEEFREELEGLFKTKTLSIVITDSGDGSNGLHYTFDDELIGLLDENQDQLDDSYQSGDGLQVRSLKVPVGCTYESLGIRQWSVLDRANYDFLNEELEDEE